MTGPDCAVIMCNLINKYTHKHTWHRMTRMTGPDCAVMCNLINTHTHVSLIPPWEDQCEWNRMTRMTGPDCAVMCNLINTHTHSRRGGGEGEGEGRGGEEGAQGRGC